MNGSRLLLDNVVRHVITTTRIVGQSQFCRRPPKATCQRGGALGKEFPASLTTTTTAPARNRIRVFHRTALHHPQAQVSRSRRHEQPEGAGCAKTAAECRSPGERVDRQSPWDERSGRGQSDSVTPGTLASPASGVRNLVAASSWRVFSRHSTSASYFEHRVRYPLSELGEALMSRPAPAAAQPNTELGHDEDPLSRAHAAARRRPRECSADTPPDSCAGCGTPGSRR